MDTTTTAPAGPARRSRRRAAGAVVAGLLTLALLALLGVAACSAADDDAGSAAAPATPEQADATAGGAGAEAPGTTTAREVAESARSVIATGTVSLTADDVADARFDVQRVVDEHDGEVADEETGTDRDGDVRHSRLVLRVPVGAFDDVMTEVAGVADLSRTTRSVEDVTTRVIDTEVRVRAQRASLQRIEALLARAEDLEEVVAIEAQLTSRQAELDSLEQQQAWLADQTSMATVTVLVERAVGVPDDVDRAGFLVGLGDGWEAMQRSALAVLTVVGAALPFVLLLAVLAVPARLVARRLASGAAARRSARTPSAAAAGPGPSTG